LKTEIEKREPKGLADIISLSVTTFGVGYLPLAPGTWGSAAGVAVYTAFAWLDLRWEQHWAPLIQLTPELAQAASIAVILTIFLLFTLLGVWASNRSTGLLGNTDPPEAVVDEVIGQLITFLFVPFGITWPLIITGFLLFRLFDIWKPYPIDSLQVLPGGIGICADDILAGIYAGICLSAVYAASLWI